MQTLEIVRMVIYVLSAITLMISGFNFVLDEKPFSIKIAPFIFTLIRVIAGLIITFNAEIIAEFLTPYIGKIDTVFYLYAVASFVLLSLALGRMNKKLF